MSVDLVSDAELKTLLDLSRETAQEGITHGTVRDFCQGADLCPKLLRYNNDIKDSQRFWTLKTILATQPVGATLIEIGAGEPVVADILGRLGYRVIVVDPYEGAGNGPLDVDHFKRLYPHVEYLVEWFSDSLTQLEPGMADCCYSISVVEHVPIPTLSTITDGIRKFTKKGGTTVHAVDFVAMGAGAEYHTEMVRTFADLLGYPEETVDAALARAANDSDTYYLSAEAHNRWRGTVAYDQFPMRKVHSLQIVGFKPSPAPRKRAEGVASEDSVTKEADRGSESEGERRLRGIAEAARLKSRYDATQIESLVRAADAICANPVLSAWVDVELFNGRRMQVNLRDEVGRQIFVHKAYEIELSRYLTKGLNPGHVFLDVGAHHGYFSILAADRVGREGAVHAFEPTPDTYRRLVQNVSVFPWVTTHDVAVGQREGKLTLKDYGEAYAAYNSAFPPRLENSGYTILREHEVSQVSIDGFCAAHSVKPDFIKVDVESMELQVIRGMSELLRFHKPVVMLEVGDFEHLIGSGIPRTVDLCAEMKRLGYSPFEIFEGELKPHIVRESYDYDIIVFTP